MRTIPIRNLGMATCLAIGLIFANAYAVPATYRNPVDGRAWSVVLDAAEPLVWQWADDAVSAKVTFSNAITKATSSTIVTRGASMDGSCPIPSSAGEDERLLAVTLAQTDGSATIAEQTVTLRVGTPSTAFVDVTDKEFQSLSEPRIYSWSSLWSDNSADATVATLTTSVKNGATIGSWTLPATSGYGTMDVKGSFGGKRGPMTAELAFDGTTYLTAELIAKGLGISIIFR